MILASIVEKETSCSDAFFSFNEQKKWLSDMDSNHDKGLQRALCYHYTIGQIPVKIAATRGTRKVKVPD